jgi:NDP-4-keto-2,6-dideoxyhexose 3-C-methyltransferase
MSTRLSTPDPDATVTVQNTCRVCGAEAPPLTSLLNLGPLHLSSFPAADATAPAHPPVPLTLMACCRCALVQLRHTTPFWWMFGGAYWYRSGVNPVMQQALSDVVWDALGRVPVVDGDVVLDIGANDGTLLRAYPPGLHRIAFEPSTPMYEALHAHCGELYAEPFPPSPDTLRAYHGKVKVITCCAVIYDLQDPRGFFAEIAKLLAPDGVCVVQFQDLGQMLTATAFDCICHEHLEYYSLYALCNLLVAHGLWATDVSVQSVNGGSLRVVIQRRDGHCVPEGTGRVLAQLEQEARQGLTTLTGLQKACADFSWRIDRIRDQVQETLAAVLDAGGTVDLYGASTKGNTLLQVLRIDSRHIRQAWERSPEKWGRQVGMTGIPIVTEVEGREDPPDLLLSTIWQFRDAVLVRERETLRRSAMLFPLPECEMVVMGVAREDESVEWREDGRRPA